MDRRRFRKIVQNLVTKLISFAPVDAACDQMAKQFLQNSLPPVLTEGIWSLYVAIEFFVTAWFLRLCSGIRCGVSSVSFIEPYL